MNTPDHRADAPATQAVLNHLLEIDPALRPHFPLAPALPAQLQTLQKINTTLKQANAQWLSQARALYQDQVPANLNQRLEALDDASTLDNQGRKTYMTFTAGSTAAELEARLNAADHLLAPSDVSMVEDCSRAPDFRPGMYALTFTYQQQTVVFAGAFVLTRQASPQVKGLTGGEKVGDVLLFTPSRGFEAFTSLAELDQNLLDAMRSPDGREEFIRHVPVRFQALDIVGIWPLELLPIEGEPLFEHTWNAVLDKRHQDVEHALSLDGKQQTSALDKALAAALPDLTQRLELRTQRLLEWNLYRSLPDWYRSAAADQQQTLITHLTRYNVSRRVFLDLLGPAATPHALAQTQLTEWLDEELDIHDLDPNQLHLITQRTVPDVGTYEQQRSLVELSLRGLHTHDEQAGSDFLQHTRLTYAGKALSDTHVALTPASLLPLLQTLGPRLDFSAVQQAMRAEPKIRQAARDMLDQRLVALACMARLQGHLSLADHQLFEQLRAGSTPHLRAQSLSLHGAQLKDLWVLREDDGRGQVKRLLLCTPESPRSQAFIAFASERECQVHVLGWAANDMHDYLVKQVPLRFVSSMKSILESISFKPDAQEHLDVTFGPPCSHTDCLNAMVSHLLDGQLLDDYEHGTPPWYRAASPADRTRLTSLSEDAIGALHSYNTRPDAEARFPRFDAYLHEQARLSLNTLLGRRQNDVDPDSVFAYAPNTLLGGSSPPISYTRLYRDGYEDGIGFINEKFSSSATFRGPTGVDLSPLTPQNVARSVTGVWIGQRYIEQVHKRLQAADSPGYVRRRDATLKITQLQMKSAALESRLKGHIASVDLAWLERAIDSLPDTSIATRNLYQVHRLSIDNDWVMGCYLFRHGDDPVLLYTPNAPDEVGFRPARLFNYLVKKDNGLLAYLTARVAVQSRTRINQFLLTAQKGLPDDINRSTPSPARYDAIQHAKPLTDLRHDLYNMRLQRRIDDVQATTVNRTQMITGILWTCVEWVTAIATIPFPALSLSLGGLLAFKDAMLALNAYYQGDKNAAFQHYLGYLANLGGALLFDLRPALAGPFNTLSPVRPLLKSAQHGEPLKHLQTHTPDTLKPVLFDGQPMWTTPIPDALGRHLLYRQDPVTGHMLSTARWVNQNAEGRWVRSGIAGGGRKKYQTLVEDADDTLAVYEVPADQARPYRAVLDPSFKNNLSQDWGVVAAQTPLDSTHEALRPLRAAYARQVDRLVQDADVFFRTPPALPTRAALPTLAVDAQIPDALKTLLGQNKRLVVGAANASIASKQMLIENMQALADMGVKRLYIENLPADLFRNKLRIINREATGNLPVALKRIEEHLARVDLALGYGHEAPFTFRRLMLQAHQHNIAVDGLDVAASYHMEHLLDLADGERLIPRSSRLRNFYSHKALQRNAAKNPDEGWIVLAEQDRIGNYERTPGLADLQNAWALRIEDVTADQPVGLWTDTLAASQSRGHVRLAVSTPFHARPKPGASAVPPTVGAVTHYAEFDMPTALRKDTAQLAKAHRGLDTRYSLRDGDPRNAAFTEFARIRQRLLDRAKAFFDAYTPPARASTSPLAQATSEQNFIERLFQYKLGLVIGEAHTAESSKAFLIKHMSLLKKQGVKTLYFEHLLTDLHQHDLDLFQRTLKMPRDLEAYLKLQDRGQMPHYQGPNTYSNVVKAANKYGIRVRALDCTASYHTKGASGSTPRNTLFSYFANEVIKADQIAYGPHKWVAFMGSAHTDMNLLVPGIAQMQDAISLHVRDTAVSTARGLQAGGWELDEFSSQALRSDFILEVGIVGRPAIRPPQPPSRDRLRVVGFFLVEHPSPTQSNLVHRSNSGEIVVTPIQVDDKGRFFVDRWEKIRDQRFLYQTQLIEALKVDIRLIPAP